MSKILDGKKLAAKIRDDIQQKVEELKKQGTTPALAVVVATKDEAALAYVRSIIKAADSVGIKTKKVETGLRSSFKNLSVIIKTLAADKNVHGIILQTPLPDGIDVDELRALIPVEKDIDGANPLSAGRLVSGLPTFAPATSVAVMELLSAYKIPLEGKRVVVVGRSRVVGKPLAHLLLDANATVTICHSKTKNLADVTREADVLVVAAGRSEFIGTEFVKNGAAVVDVGTNVGPAGKLVGDVEFTKVSAKSSAISPVPGGVGPVTTAILLAQTMRASQGNNV